jgi:hypothetical protein
MRQAGHGAHEGEEKFMYVLVGKAKERRPFERLWRR